MAYGLRIINDDSELLIDSEYLNPTFVQKLEFDTTPTLVEAASGFIHPGYIRREYKTTNTVSMGVAGMAYVVMWTLPDNGASDIYYNFDSSVAYLTEKLTCFVYANSTGSALTYTLPTAYVFAVTAAGINSLTSTGPALRMYNSSGQKTFDSNFAQLAPYSITDTFAFSVSGANVNNYGTTPVSIALSIPTNPIFMLPDFHALRINKGPVNSIAHQEYLYETAFRRVGSTLYTRLYVVDYYNEDYAWPLTQTTFTSGNNNQLSVIVADANIYEAVSAGGGGGGSNPTYTLSSNFTSRDEGTTVVVTLNTTLVADYTEFFYTVTGITASDLSAGGVTGKFVIVNNTATASFTFANDLSTGEGSEIFTLSLDGLTQSVSVTVNDTSKAGTFSWSTPGNVNEGATGYTTFNATNAGGKTVTFAVVAPLAGVSISGSSDGALLTSSWTVVGDAATSINVQYSAVADAGTEGPEAFRLAATVDGVTYTSNDIIVNDTSKTVGYSISAADNWNESNSYSVTIGANNVNGTTLYLTTDNSLVTPSSSTVTVNSDTFTTNISYTAGSVTANTVVRLHVRTGSAAGTIQAFKDITVVNVAPSYSFEAASAFNEGASGSIQFNYSYAANQSISFSLAAPTSGASGVSDVTLNTTSYAVGSTNASGNVSVTYSAGADTTTEGAEYFRIAATVGGTTYYSGDITINDTSLYPAAGTPIGVASCVPGTFILRQVRANGTGGTYNDDTANSPTCGYVAASYSFTRSVTSVNEPGSFTITLNTNQSGSFPYTISGVDSADINNASLTGSLSNGGVLTVNVTADAKTEGTETFTITLNNGLATTSVTINDTSLYPSPGTYLSQFCSGYNLYYTYADGSGGTYNTLIQTNSATCGYVAPAYSLGNTWSTIANGVTAFFYLYATNASGTAVTVSKSGTGSSRVTVDPTSFTISGTPSTTYIQVTVSSPTGSIAAQSVTISLSTGQSFTFTIDAYSAVAPLVSSVVDSMSNPIYYNGETITYNINMNGAVTPDTYVRVAIWINVLSDGSGGQEAGYNIFQGGQPISGVYGFFTVGSYAGYYTTNPNAGYNFKVMVKAKAVTSGGVDRQSYVNGTVRQLSSSAPP